jgi:hypothetical protein
MATLSLPQAKDTHFLVYSAGAKSVLSELWSSPERRLSLRLPPGRYVIHRRLAGAGGLATIAVGEGEERKVEDKDFTAGSLELLAKKGGDPDADVVVDKPVDQARHHELYAGYDMGANVRTGFVHGPRIGYAYAWRHVALTVGGGADFSGRSLELKDEKLVSGFGRAGVELRLPLGALTLRGGAGARAGVLAQNIDYTGPNPQLVILPNESQTAFVFGPELLVAARVALGQTFFVDVGGTGSVLFLREAGTMRGITGAVAALTLGARF